MANVNDNRTIDLSKIIDFSADLEYSYVSVIAHILPKPGKLNQV